MAKKNSIKDTEQTLSLFGKIRAIFKNETIHFVIGLILFSILAISLFFVLLYGSGGSKYYRLGQRAGVGCYQ